MNLARRVTGKNTLLRDERGLTTVEYVIILVLLAVMAIGVWKNFGGAVQSQVKNSQTAIDGLNTPPPAGGTPAPAPGPK